MSEKSYVIENELVEQNTIISNQIVMEHFDAALAMLQVVLPVWAVAGYRYKGAELCNQLASELQGRPSPIFYKARSQKKRLEKQLNQVWDLRKQYS